MNMDSSEPAEALDINFSTTDGEQMFDLLDGLRAATWSISQAITPADPPDRDENGQAINSLSQEVANVSSALRDVAGALHAIAEAIREHGSRRE